MLISLGIYKDHTFTQIKSGTYYIYHTLFYLNAMSSIPLRYFNVYLQLPWFPCFKINIVIKFILLPYNVMSLIPQAGY